MIDGRGVLACSAGPPGRLTSGGLTSGGLTSGGLTSGGLVSGATTGSGLASGDLASDSESRWPWSARLLIPTATRMLSCPAHGPGSHSSRARYGYLR